MTCEQHHLVKRPAIHLRLDRIQFRVILHPDHGAGWISGKKTVGNGRDIASKRVVAFAAVVPVKRFAIAGNTYHQAMLGVAAVGVRGGIAPIFRMFAA